VHVVRHYTRVLRGAVGNGDTLGVRQRLLLATNNAGKAREFERLLAGSGFETVTPREVGVELSPVEMGSSYAENATMKAQAFAIATGLIALADDSGIEVDALGGGPGMYSARYGGEELDDRERTQYLLEEMKDVADDRRTARYRAVVAVAHPGGEVRLFEGVQEGQIARAPRGERGFGYDPVFLAVDGRTNAELEDGEKDAISHRGLAVRAAAEYLRGSVA